VRVFACVCDKGAVTKLNVIIIKYSIMILIYYILNILYCIILWNVIDQK
jgi:hypothetical protein